MAVYTLRVDMRCDDRLHIITKSLSEKCLSDLVGEFGCDIIIGRETLYVMDSFHRAFALQRRRAVKMVFGELVIDQPHLQVGGFSVGHAIYRCRVKQVLGLVGI